MNIFSEYAELTVEQEIDYASRSINESYDMITSLEESVLYEAITPKDIWEAVKKFIKMIKDTIVNFGKAVWAKIRKKKQDIQKDTKHAEEILGKDGKNYNPPSDLPKVRGYAYTLDKVNANAIRTTIIDTLAGNANNSNVGANTVYNAILQSLGSSATVDSKESFTDVIKSILRGGGTEVEIEVSNEVVVKAFLMMGNFSKTESAVESEAKILNGVLDSLSKSVDETSSEDQGDSDAHVSKSVGYKEAAAAIEIIHAQKLLALSSQLELANLILDTASKAHINDTVNEGATVNHFNRISIV